MAVAVPNEILEQFGKEFGLIPLVKFEIPSFTRGYYYGPRPLVHNGFTYQPNAIIGIDELVETLDNFDEERTITLTGTSSDFTNAASQIQNLNYVGSPVTVSTIVVNTKTNEKFDTALNTAFYEIYDLSVETTPEGSNFNIEIKVDLRARGYTGRRKTSAVRSSIIHRENFDPTSTFYDESDKVQTIQRKWGQRYA